MTIAPEEICRRLGEPRFSEMFFCLSAAQMKEILGMAKISTTRQLSHTSIKKRNEDWGRKLFRALPTGNDPIAFTLLYQWLSTKRNEMLGAFLDLIGVTHKNGLTDENFWETLSDEKAQQAGKALLEDGKFQKDEVAAYLLFLDMHHKTTKLSALDLPKYLPAQTAKS